MNKGRLFAGIFLVFAVVFIAGSVSAVCTDSSTDLFLKISSTSNAHAQLPGQTGYTIRYCINELAGLNFGGGGTFSTSCTDGDGKIVRISSQNNAHAEGPAMNTPGYIDVCFKNTQTGASMDCSLRTSCLQGETPLFSLSGNTNAHLGTTNTYSNNICCKLGPRAPGSPTISTFTSNPVSPVPAGTTSLSLSWSGTNLPSCTVSSNQGYNSGSTSQTTINNVAFVSPSTTYTLTCGSASQQLTVTSGQVPTCGGIGEACCAGNSCTSGTCQSGTCQTVGACTLSNIHWNPPTGTGSPRNVGSSASFELQYTAGCNNVDYRLNFEVYDDDGIGDDLITSNPTTTFGGSGFISSPWGPNGIIWSNTADDDELPGSPELEYYFKATVYNVPNGAIITSIEGSQNTADELIVNPPTNPVPPSPIATIIGPIHRGVYFVGTNIELKATNVNPPLPAQPYTYEWLVDGENSPGSETTVNYNPSTSGQKTITLRLKSGTTILDEAQVAILVVPAVATAQNGIMGFVNYPNHRQVIQRASDGRYKLDFEAKDSFVVEVSGTAGNCPTLTCKAGWCNVTTENVPAGVCGAQTKLSISGGSQTPPASYGSLGFAWNFNDGSNASGVTGTKYYSDTGDKVIDLTTTFTPSGGSQITKTFKRNFVMGQCIDSGRVFVEVNSAGRWTNRKNTMTDAGACTGPDGSTSGTDNCCPAGHSCTTVNQETKCRPLTLLTNINKCADYNSTNFANNANAQVECNNDENTYQAWRRDPLFSVEPKCGTNPATGEVVQCECKWNTVNNVAGCRLDKVIFGNNGQSGTCTYSQNVVQECTNGYMTVQVSATGNAPGGGTCPGQGTQTVLCGRPTFELPFFGWKQFFTGLVVVAIVYGLLHSRKFYKHR